MTRALVLQLCRKAFLQRWKVVKQVFIRRKKSTVWIDTWVGFGTESLSCNLVAVWITFMGHFFQVSFGQSSWFAWFTVSILVYLRILPCRHTHLLAKMNSTKNVYGYSIPWHHSLFDLQESFLSCCVAGEVSWLPEWEICGLGRAHSPPLIVPLFSSWSFSPQGLNLQLLYSGGGRHLAHDHMRSWPHDHPNFLYPNSPSCSYSDLLFLSPPKHLSPFYR